eukprot:Sspe_Gene.4431::Locus_1454_Transcript_1_1_Confidence_1.000_Length_372::g.4431::m.4431
MVVLPPYPVGTFLPTPLPPPLTPPCLVCGSWGKEGEASCNVCKPMLYICPCSLPLSREKKRKYSCCCYSLLLPSCTPVALQSSVELPTCKVMYPPPPPPP